MQFTQSIVFDKFKYLWAVEGNQCSCRKLVSMETPLKRVRFKLKLNLLQTKCCNHKLLANKLSPIIFKVINVFQDTL